MNKNVLLLVGSPKANGGTSKILGDVLVNKLAEQGYCQV